jgi:ParB family chromosome partitioning protein
MSPGGYLLRFTGPQAKSPGLIDDVLDKVEEWFGGE